MAQGLTSLEVLQLHAPHGDTLWSLLASRAAGRGAHPLIEFEGDVITYAQALERAGAFVAWFAARGVRGGDRVALMCHNHPCVALIWFALARLGAIMVPINPEFGPTEAGYILGHAEVAGVVCDPGAVDTVRAATAGMRAEPWIVLRDAMTTDATLSDRSASADSADATCLLIYTSGTTGFPKGVMHAQRSMVMGGEAFVERILAQPDERILCVLPMFHMNALVYSLCGTIAAGATMILVARFSAGSFWQTVAASRATEVNTIAALSNILIARPRAEFVPGHTLRKIYGAPFPAAAIEVFNREFGVPTVLEGYGMSEIPGVLNNPVEPGPRPGSMGVLARHPDHSRPFSQVRIIDDAGNEVAAGVTGEITVRTPIIMQGYWRDPEQTRAAFRDGWFLTGDLGCRDADGYYWFVARKKDIIRRRGENISGAELDRVIGEHPGVAEAAALAVPAPLGEDDILVAVVRRPGAQVSAPEVADWCRSRLAAHKVPRYVAFVDDLPHTPTHRVAKHRMRAAELQAAAVDLG